MTQSIDPGSSKQQGQQFQSAMASGQATGASNEFYNVVSVLYHCLKNAAKCELYMKDSSDQEINQFFQQVRQQESELAQRARQLLLQRWNQSDISSQSDMSEQTYSSSRSGLESQNMSSSQNSSRSQGSARQEEINRSGSELPQ